MQEKTVVWRGAISIAVLLILFTLGFASRGEQNEIRYVGVPDGAAGVMVRYVTEEKVGGRAIRTIRFAPYTLYDCCASATQYAMGAGRLDMAVMCPEAAQALVAKDKRYEIAGPVIVNSDVLVTRPDTSAGPLAIAVSQKRRFQHRLVKQRLGPRGRPVPMLHSAVPFAYARCIVQGAVVDITKAFNLGGVLSPAADQDGGGMITYVLVVKRRLQDKKHYHQFMAHYAQAVREVQNRDVLLNLLKTYINDDITIGDVKTWQKMNVHFTHPLNSRRRG
jgi:hypothetical protein